VRSIEQRGSLALSYKTMDIDNHNNKPGEAGRQQVRVLKSAAEIEEFRNVWKGWPGHLYTDIDFFLAMAEARKPLVEPHVTVLLSDGVPKAMAVGYIAQEVLDFKISHKSLFHARIRTISVLRGGILGDQSRETATAMVSALMETLQQGEADALIIGHTPVDSEFYKLLREKVPLLCRDHTLEIHPHWKMNVPDTMEEVYARLSGEHRKKLRWQNRNFEKNFPGAVAVRCFKETAELEKMIRDVEEISKKTYQRSLGASFIDNELNRKRVALEAEKGWLRMYVLYVGAKPCAYWWGASYGKTFFSEAMGFDPEYRRYSPGMYLLTKTLEDFCRSGVKDLDFGAREYHYKKQFGDYFWNETEVFYVFAPKLWPVALNLMRTLFGGVRFLGKRVLNFCHAPGPLKKLWSRKVEKSSEKPVSNCAKGTFQPVR